MPNSVAEPRQCRMPRDCDLRHVKSMSEKLIASHYENNYGGSVFDGLGGESVPGKASSSAWARHSLAVPYGAAVVVAPCFRSTEMRTFSHTAPSVINLQPCELTARFACA